MLELVDCLDQKVVFSLSEIKKSGMFNLLPEFIGVRFQESTFNVPRTRTNYVGAFMVWKNQYDP